MGNSYASFAHGELIADCDTPEKFSDFCKEHFPEDATLRESIVQHELIGERMVTSTDAELAELLRDASPKFKSWVAHLRTAAAASRRAGGAAAWCSCGDEEAPAPPAEASADTVVSQPTVEV